MNPARIVKIAKALADPTRYKMLRAIQAAGELNCSQVCEKFPLSQPTISHHLRTLHNAGILTVRRKGQYHILGVNQSALDEFGQGFASSSTGRDGAARGRSRTRANPKSKAARK